MEAEEMIERLASAVALRVRPSVPFELELWTTKEIGAYIKCDPDKVVARYACRPDFPRPVRIPTAEGRTSHPRWYAKEVVQWVDGYKEDAA